MKFKLKVYENAHYRDESEAWITGDFSSSEGALAEAKKMVRDFLLKSWKKGISPEELYRLYTTFGEDPVIISVPEGLQSDFSAWTYAKAEAMAVCRELEPHRS